MLCRLADFVFDLRPRYPYLSRICRDYGAEGAAPDFVIEVGEEELEKEREKQPGMSPGYLESICAYRKIADAVATHGAMVMHAAVIVTEGRAYAFTAKSGTGKSTHVSLWMQALGDRAYILNGDKPILRRTEDGGIWAYGTPWCGKENWNRNASAPLAGLCFLSRAAENSIRPMPKEEAVDLVFPQLLRPSTKEGIVGTLAMADLLLSGTPLYRLGCNISREAAETSYFAMTGNHLTEETVKI